MFKSTAIQSIRKLLILQWKFSVIVYHYVVNISQSQTPTSWAPTDA